MLAATPLAVIQIVVAVAALTALVIQAQKSKTQAADDDRLLNGATRGSAVPVVIGKAKLGGYYFWQQPDLPNAVSTGRGGKFGSNAGSTTFYEEFFTHLIGVNVDKLYAILEDDEVIFEGPITPLSHPSGTAVDLGERGMFEVYWGEIDQPIPSRPRNRSFANAANTDFVSASGVSGQLFNTRCHGVARIDWIPKNLGGRQVSPRLEYIVGGTVRSQLGESQAHIPEGYDNTQPMLWEDVSENISHSNLGGNLDYTGGRIFFGDYAPTDELAFRIFRAQGGTNPNSRYVDISTGRPFETDLSIPLTLNGVPCDPLIATLFAPGTIVRLQDGTQDGQNPAEGPYGNPSGNALRNFNGGVMPSGNFEYFYVQKVEFISADGVVTSAGAPNWTKPANYQAVWRGFLRVYIGEIVDQSALPFFTPITTLPTAQQFFQIVPVAAIADDGVNPAHMIDQIMFAPAPYGAGLDRDFYDMPSLEQVGRQLALFGEGYRGSIDMIDYTTARQAVERIMEDTSMICTLDPEIGRYVFDLIREPVPAEAIQISNDVVVAGDPHSKTNHLRRDGHQLFEFTDQTNNFRTMPITVDEDGKRRLEQRTNLTKHQITTTRNPGTAFSVAERRARLLQAQPWKFDFEASRGCRMLRAGHVVEVEGVDRLLRVMAVKRDPYTDQCKVESVADAYGFQVDGIVNVLGRGERIGNSPQFLAGAAGPEGGSGPSFGAGGGAGVGEPPPAIWRAWELPVELTPATGRVALLKGRQTTSASGCAVWISGDDVDFRVTAMDPYFQVVGIYGGDGGTPGNIQISLHGPEEDGTDLLENLSTQDFNAGRQFVVVGDEVMFVKSWTALGGNTWEAEAADIQRQKWGSSLHTLAVGDPLFVVVQDRFLAFDDPLLSPGATVYFKAQNVRRGGSSGRSIGDIDSQAVTVTMGGKERASLALDATMEELAPELERLGLFSPE